MRTLLAAASLLALAPACRVTEREEGSFRLEWTDLESGVAVGLRGVGAVDARVAWASGAAGTWLRTTDGGEHWESGRVPGCEELDFRDVHAFSAERALLVSAGAPARFVETTDGGRSWVVRHADDTPGVFFDAVDFWDERRGLAFGDPRDGSLLLLRTTDGGASWHPVPAPPRALPGEAGFAASGTCLDALPGTDSAWIGLGGATGRPARLLVTHDAGDTWQSLDTPLPAGESAGIFSVAFRDPQHGVIVGGDYRAPEERAWTAATTRDGGRTWGLPAVPPGGYRSAVRYVPGAPVPTAVAAGETGVDVSVDGGRTWAGVHPLGYHALDFAPSEAGWAVGAEGRVARVRVVPGPPAR